MFGVPFVMALTTRTLDANIELAKSALEVLFPRRARSSLCVLRTNSTCPVIS